MICPDMRDVLARVAAEIGTPAYVYFADEVRQRVRTLRSLFGGRLGIRYAVKSNPNVAVLREIRRETELLDISSIAESVRGSLGGFEPENMSFTGPAKRPFELQRAIEDGIGEVVVESMHELEVLDECARRRGRPADIMIRINPATTPKRFGVTMSGKPSQFGVDEEDVPAVLNRIRECRHLNLVGFHIYAGTNSLDPVGITENIASCSELFRRFARMAEGPISHLIFGSGFGIPYTSDDRPLDVEQIAKDAAPIIDQIKAEPKLANAKIDLELGRWLVGPCGYLLSSVVAAKRSRGVEIRLLDAGFNNHLSAYGMMGTIVRRNWPIEKISKSDSSAVGEYLLVGPLCTTIDVLASKITLPALKVGDVVAVESSGAYGLSASPTRFISHPDPREVLVRGDEDSIQIEDITESPELLDGIHSPRAMEAVKLQE